MKKVTVIGERFFSWHITGVKKATPTLQANFKPVPSSYALWHHIGPNRVTQSKSMSRGWKLYFLTRRPSKHVNSYPTSREQGAVTNNSINYRDPVWHVFIFVTLLLSINHMLLVMKSLQRNPLKTPENTEDVILSASLNSRNPFLFPLLYSNAWFCPKEAWNLSKSCHWLCSLLSKDLRVLLLKW